MNAAEKLSEAIGMLRLISEQEADTLKAANSSQAFEDAIDQLEEIHSDLIGT